MWLINAHVSPYQQGNRWNHEPLRARKLLMHRNEILRLSSEAQRAGGTLVPLSVYDKRGKIKVQLGVAKGKRQYDKRETLAKRDAQRDVDRALSDHERDR